jgi:hypothetical protein
VIGNPEISTDGFHPYRNATPGVALSIADLVWTIGDLLETALSIEPNRPIRVKRKFTVIDGGRGLSGNAI